jgi:6-pyruvoyltetrahydropterin/6-carboxytetrahydropterin synthase
VIALTQRYAFPAAHVLRHDAYSDAENEAVFGKCANPAGHGHNYGVEVTVTGPVDERSGRIIAPELLDRIFDSRIGQRFGRRMLNDDPAFEQRVPTAENIASVIHAELAPEIARASTAQLLRVRVVETRNNSCTTGASE